MIDTEYNTEILKILYKTSRKWLYTLPYNKIVLQILIYLIYHDIKH